MAEDKIHIDGLVSVKTWPKPQPQEVKQTSITSESITINGLSGDFFNGAELKAKEKGLSTVLTAILGLKGGADTLDGLASSAKAANNILNPESVISKDLKAFLKRFDKKFVDNIVTIKDTLGAILSAMTNTSQITGTDETGADTVAVVLDTSKAQNIESLIKSSTLISNDPAAFEGLKKLEEFFTELNRLTNEEGIVTIAVNNVNNIPSLSGNLRNKMETMAEIFGMLGGMSNVDLSKIKEVTEGIDEIFKKLNENLITINELPLIENIDSLKPKFEEIKKFYTEDIAITADTIQKNANNLEIISKSAGDAYQVAISADLSIDREKLEESKADIGSIIDSIALLGIVMLIGGAIMKKHPDLIKGSLMFGATLAVFLMELMIPIFLITKIASNKTLEGNIGEVILYVSAMSLIMMLGAWLGSSNRMIRGALKFGFALTSFLTMLMIPIGILIVLGENAVKVLEHINNITKIIITSAVLMFLGALLIDTIDIKKALTFGVLLGTFIFEVITPFIIFSIFARKAYQIAEEVNKLIITCSIILMLGALIMNQPGLIKKALEFGAVLGLFITLTILPMMIFAMFEGKAHKTIKAVQWYIITASIIMLVGAMLVKDKEFVKNTLLFGGIFMLFIVEVLTPILVFSIFAKLAELKLLELAAFIGITAFIMMVGAFFIQSGLWKSSLAYGALLTAFIWAVTSPFIVGTKLLSMSILGAKELGIFVLTCAASLVMGVYIAKNFKKAIGGALIVAGFVVGMLALIKLINAGTNTVAITNASSLMIGVGLVMLATIGTIWALKKFDIEKEDIKRFLTLEIIVGLEIALIAKLTESMTAQQGKQALMIMVGVSAVMISTVMSVWLIKQFDINRYDILRFLQLQAIVGIELALLLKISQGLNTQQGMQALIIMAGVTLTIMANIFIMKYLRDFQPSKEDVKNFAIIYGVVAIETLLMKWISKNIDEKQALKALALMGIVTLVMTASIGIIWLLRKSGAEASDAGLLLLIQGVLFLTALMVIGIGKLAEKFEQEIWTGLVILGILNLFLFTSALTISMISKAEVTGKHLLILLGMEGLLLLLGGIAIGLGALATIPATAAFFWAGLAVIGALTLFIVGLGHAAMVIATVAKMSEGIKNVDAVGNLFHSFLGMIANLPINPIILAKLIFKGTMITTLVMTIAPALWLVTRLVKNIASLKIEELNEDGSVKSRRQLEAADFAKVGTNINLIINSLISGIESASKVIERIKITTLLKTLYTVNQLGNVIGNIATGIQEYAKLMVPEYNEDGSIKKYRLMSKDDFKLAGENISLIITTVGNTIADIASGKDPKSSSWLSALRGGMISLKRTKFGQVLEISTMLGQMISSVAEGISTFANWRIPKYDKDGNQIGTEQMSNAYIDNAIQSINTILTLIPNTIIELAKREDFMELISGKEKKSILRKTLNVCLSLGEMISSIAQGIQEMANLRFVSEYNSDGSPKKYIAITSGLLRDAADNISIVLGVIMDAVIDKAKQIEDDSKKAQRSFEALISVGELVSNMASGIAAMSELKFAIYDKDGNVVDYISLANGDFTQAGLNIGRLMTGMIEALADSYKLNKDKIKQLPKMITEINPVGEFIGTMADIILKLAVGKYTLNDEEFRLTEEDITKAISNISSMFNAIVDIVNNDNMKQIVVDNTLKTKLDQVSSVLTLLSAYADSLAKYATFTDIESTIEVIKKVIGDKETVGLIKYINDGLNDLHVIPSTQIDNISQLITNLIGIHDSMFDYIKTISDNKDKLNVDPALITNISNVIVALIESSKSFANADLIDEVVFNAVNIKTYLDLYKETLTSLSEMSELFNIVNNLYDSYFSNGNTIDKKINDIISSIQSTIFIVTNSFVDRNTSKIGKLLGIAFDSISNEISIDVALLNLKHQLKSYETVITLLNEIPDLATINSIDFTKTNENILSILFGKNSRYIDRTSIIGILNEISNHDLGSKRKTAKLESEINEFGSIVRTLIDISNYGTVNPQVIEDAGLYIETISKGINDIKVDNNKLIKWDKEVKSLDGFVKALNTVDVSKVAKMNELMQSLDNLAQHVGGLDKLAEAINTDLADLLTKLMEHVEIAQKTIDRAELIEKDRQTRLANNIERISKMMDGGLTVNVGKLKSNGNTIAGQEK